MDIQLKYHTLQGYYGARTTDGRCVPIDSAKISLASRFPTLVPCSLPKKIRREKDRLIENISLFLTIQYIWQNTCLQPSNTALYRELLQKAKLEQLPFSYAVKSHLIKQIGSLYPVKNPLHYVQWLWTRLKTDFLFFFFTRVIKYFASKGISYHLNALDEYIKMAQKKDDLISLRTELISNVNRCLTIFSGAYTAITKKLNTSGSINEMVALELTNPDSNQGLSSQRLYQKTAMTIIQRTLGRFYGFIAATILGWFISPAQIVETLVATASGSALDNRGYSYRMNLFFLDQLRQIAHALKYPSTDQRETDPLSGERQRQLSTVITQLLDVLNKSECQSIDELSWLIEQKGFWPAVQLRHLEKWGVSQVMESIAVTIASLLQILNEEKLQDLTYQTLRLSNNAFYPTPNVSVRQMKKSEYDVSYMTKQILKSTIDRGIYGALTNQEPWLGSYYLPNPIVIGKKLLSTVRFIPSLMTPRKLTIGTFLATPFLSHTAANHVLKVARYYKFSSLTLPYPLFGITSINLENLLSKETVNTVQTFLKDHATFAGLYVSLPLLSLYGVYWVVHARAINRVQALFRLSTQPNAYLCFLHHLLLLPYLKRPMR
ncbi:MAG: hypothetical protein RLZZ453_1287 [Chlamydiota bacterium]|jgi:hypothetical protein